MKIKKWNGSAWIQDYPEVNIASIVATGTPSGTTFLRGDGQWATLTVNKGDLTYLYMYGKAQSAITKGQAVQFAGVQGDHILLKPAVPSEINANPDYFVGIAEATLATNDFGYILTQGELVGVNTNSYTAGDVLWFASAGSTAGALTATEPVNSNSKIQVGSVTKVNATEGIIFTRVNFVGTEIEDIVASGTASSSTFLRGDGTWATPSDVDTNNYLTGVSGSGNGTVTFTRQGLSNLTWDASHTHSISFFNSAITSNLDTLFGNGQFGFANTTTGRPEDYGQGINIVSSGTTHNGTDNWITQLAFGTAGSTSFFRTKVNTGAWTAWRKIWNDANDGAGSGLDADLLDGQHGSYFLDTSGSSQTKTGALTVGGNLTASNNAFAGRYYQSANGIPTGNLGSPTVTEMALFDEQFYNQTNFYDITKLKFYTSTDNVTWTEVTTISDTNKRALVGGDAGSGITIPNLTPYYRIEITNNGNYVFLNALYMYVTTSSHSMSIKIKARRRSDLTFVNITSSNNTVNLWPGHVYMPFNTIPFLTGGSSSGHYDIVHIDFQPTWSGDPTYGSFAINLHKLQVWGGYPAGKRNVYSTDENRNVAFPAALTGTRLFSTIATGTSPLSVTSTTVNTNLNADLLDGYHETSFIRLAASSGSATNGNFAIGTASSRNFIQSHLGQPLDINPLGNSVAFDTDTLFVDATNNRVGIGTTSPDSRLAMQMTGTTASGYTSASNAIIKLDSGSATNSVINLVGGGELGIYHSNSSGAYDVGIGFGTNADRILRFDTTGAERMRINASGNVGIGTASPAQKLTVVGASSDPSLTATASAIANFIPTGVGTQLVVGGSGSSPFTIWLQNRHTGIDGLSYPIALNPSGGNVGIATTTPSEKLEVSGNAKATTFISTQATGTAPLTVASTTAVTNLNADLLDGNHAAAFALASHTHAIADVTSLQTSLDAKAPLASPTLTGTPAAPTATAGTNTTQIATTAFITSQKGSANGIVPLNASSKINETYLPNFIFGGMRYIGSIGINTTAETLLDSAQNHVASNGGTVSGCYFIVSGTATVTITGGTDTNNGVTHTFSPGPITQTGEEDDNIFDTIDLEPGDWFILNDTWGPYFSTTYQRWSVVNNTYALVTTSAPGIMSGADKTKLDGIAASANNYSHPTDGANSTITNANGLVLSSITVNTLGHVTAVGSKTLAAADIPTLNQNTTGSAATLTTARTLTLGSTGKTFNGSADVSWSLAEIGASATAGSTSITTLGTVSTGTWSASTIAVNRGGTGATSLTSGSLLVGAGTGAVTTVAPKDLTALGQLAAAGTAPTTERAVYFGTHQREIAVSVAIAASTVFTTMNFTSGMRDFWLYIHQDTTTGSVIAQIPLTITSAQSIGTATPGKQHRVAWSNGSVTQVMNVDIFFSGTTLSFRHNFTGASLAFRWFGY